MIQLNVLSGKKAGSQAVVRRFPFRVGRAPDNHLQLDDDGVWDQHLALELRKDGFNPRALRRAPWSPSTASRFKIKSSATATSSPSAPRNCNSGSPPPGSAACASANFLSGRSSLLVTARPVRPDLLAAAISPQPTVTSPQSSLANRLWTVEECRTDSMPEMPRAGERHRHARARPPPQSPPRPAPSRPAGSPPSRPRPPPRAARRETGKTRRCKPRCLSSANFASPAFQTAMRLASTRLIWPAPTPSVRSAPQ